MNFAWSSTGFTACKGINNILYTQVGEADVLTTAHNACKLFILLVIQCKDLQMLLHIELQFNDVLICLLSVMKLWAIILM